MCHKVKDGAIFIADVHYPNHSKDFLNFLEAIESKRLSVPQLFLMGDIFDLLVGQSNYLRKRFKDEVLLIDKIAKEIEVIYIEGNHDFNLSSLFKNVKVYDISNQPVDFENSISVAHGDKFATSFSYKLYTKLIRNPFILKLIPNSYAKNKLKKLSNKKICNRVENFKNIIIDIKKYYPSNLIIEGHFHQGVIFENYVSLPSFACTNEYAVYKNSSVKFKKFRI